MNRAWYNKKWVVVIFHIVTWVVLFSLPYVLRPAYSAADQPKNPIQDSTAKFIVFRINDLLLIAFFYFNAFNLFPGLVYRNKYLLYLLSLSACFLLLLLQGWWLNKSFVHTDGGFTIQRHAFFMLYIFLFILACSIAYRAIRDKISADHLAQEKENEFLKTELALLRSQVSPHFMFNVLNNMVALARKQSEQLEPSLIKLSSLMRYMLYETDEAKVSLERETDYLQSYIDLQKQRFGKKVNVQTSFHVPDKTYFIEPMLLIPFVENAFKHGTGMIEQALIHIELRASKGQLEFVVQNRFNDQSGEIKDKASGIGLANVARRLQLLYRQQHSLSIEKKDDLFTVKLSIELS